MADVEKSLATMMKNIEAQTGKSLAEFAALIKASGLTRHGQIRSMLMEKFALGYGHANAVVHLALGTGGQTAAENRNLSGEEVLAEMYRGKEDLRPLHDAILGVIEGLGPFEPAPKKGYVSYRRKKQFATVGPRTKTAIEIGLAARQLPAHPRLKEMPPNSMCRYTTRVSTPSEIDGTLRSWLRQSFDEAG